MKTCSPTFCKQLISVLLFTAAASQEAPAQGTFPSRALHIVVPGPAGTGFDTTARLMAPGLSDRLGRQVVVENRAGAGTMIGNDFVAKSPPDGYTLLMAASAIAIQPALYKKMPYDAMRDFAPITQAVSVPNVIAVHPSVPAKSVKEMIALARARPGELMYSSAGTGANSHLTLELFASMAKIRLVHVPYKGATPAMIDLIGGHVAIMSIPVSDALPQVRSGKLRALGMTSPKRISAAPEIPTIAEAGLPGYESVNWFGLLVPAGTAQEIIARLHKESVAALRSPSVKERMDSDSIEVVGNMPDEFAAFIKSETVKWAAVVKNAGIKPE